MRTILILLLLASTPLLAQSYEKLEGRRLGQFSKTAGASEAGKLVAFQLPASILAKAEIGKGPPKGRRHFLWQKLRIEVDENNCYWRQTLRKLAKDSKGSLILKGRVSWRKDGKGGRDHFLLLDSIQKSTGRS
ncbi:MAG: hypothetical protein H6807_07960 [Planctomycetes bacterium]|nr:hypothetical protein [Planctomycetota bacterium]